MKSSMDRLKSRIEKRISELEDSMLEIIQSEQQREKAFLKRTKPQGSIDLTKNILCFSFLFWKERRKSAWVKIDLKNNGSVSSVQ